MASGLLVGFCDGPLGSQGFTDEGNNLKENFIGGQAIYPLEECQVNLKTFNCKACGVKLCLLLQLYCPVSQEDRFIHVFACCSSNCTDATWMVTRTIVPYFNTTVKLNATSCKEQSKDVPPDNGDDGWFDEDGANDWSVPGVSSKSEERPLSEAISQQSVITKLPEEVAGFKAFYISVEEDSQLNHRTKSQAGPCHAQVQVSENDSGECYEKSVIPGLKDELASKFWKKLNKMPDQIIRYNLNGSPLLNRTIDKLDKLIQTCSACGSKRIFELQLMPALVSILKPCKPNINPPEFATVLIFTCSKDCSINQIVIEQAIVLEDPDDSFLKSKFKDNSRS